MVRRIIEIVLVIAACVTAGPARAQNAPDPIVEARRLYDLTKYEEVIRLLDPVIVQWQGTQDPGTRTKLTMALELRGRARFGAGNRDGARTDFSELLKTSPAYMLTGTVNRTVSALFEDVKKTLVGQVRVRLPSANPQDPNAAVLDGVRLEIDAAPVVVDASGVVTVPLAVGPHQVSAKRLGCKPWSAPVQVAPGAVQEVNVALERSAAVVTFFTSPPGVEVSINGTSRGRTVAGPLPAKYAEWPAKMGVAASAVSEPFVLDDLTLGNYVLELRLDCYTSIERTLTIDRLADLLAGPYALAPAVGSISVSAKSGAAKVYLDNELKGDAPFTIDPVCEGTRTVELRTSYGRYEKQVMVKPGDRLTVEGAVKPVIALLTVTGLPEGYRGLDPRLSVKKAFDLCETCVVTVPSLERVRQALKENALVPGWLSFNTWRRAIPNSAAEAIKASARQELASKLTRTFDVQAVAELTALPGGNHFLMSVLAAGSGEPDVYDIELDQPGMPSVREAAARLDRELRLAQPSVGLFAVDVADAPSPVVVSVQPAGTAETAGIATGEMIASAGGEPVKQVSDLMAVLSKQPAGARVPVEVKDRRGATRRVDLVVSMVPRLMAIEDQSWTFNGVLIALRTKVAQADAATDTTVLRLNLAVALIRVGNHAEALNELRRIRLPNGPGISNGTVQFLTGLCYEGMQQQADAEAAYAAAAKLEGQITEEGPPIKDLAEARLAVFKRAVPRQ